MRKTALVDRLVDRVPGVTKQQAGDIVDEYNKAISDAVKQGERVSMNGFGSLKLRHRDARVARNPKTNEKVDVPPRYVVSFKETPALKEELTDLAKKNPNILDK